MSNLVINSAKIKEPIKENDEEQESKEKLQPDLLKQS